MEISTFLAHFLFIGLTFTGGLVVGWQTYPKVSKYFQTRKQNKESSIE